MKRRPIACHGTTSNLIRWRRISLPWALLCLSLSPARSPLLNYTQSSQRKSPNQVTTISYVHEFSGGMRQMQKLRDGFKDSNFQLCLESMVVMLCWAVGAADFLRRRRCFSHTSPSIIRSSSYFSLAQIHPGNLLPGIHFRSEHRFLW